MNNSTQQNVSSHKMNQPNQNYGNIREPYNGKPLQGNIQQNHYQQQYYPQHKYPSKTPQSSSSSSATPQQQQITNNSLPSSHLTNNFGQSSNSSNFSNYSHPVATSYPPQQNYEYSSPSSSSMSTITYATPSPSQYSFASSSPSTNTTQVPSPDTRQQNVVHSSVDTEHESNRDYALSNQYKTAIDSKSFNPTQPPNYKNYNTDSMSGHYSTSDNCAYSGSLKKYRHKQQHNNKTPQIYGGGSNEFKMDDHYAGYPMESIESESTLSFLEKTASSIDESKSAFKTSLSNITKPNPDILGYSSQALYGSSAPSIPAKSKAKPKVCSLENYYSLHTNYNV